MKRLSFFFKQKTAYEMRISDWSSDVCSSDLILHSTSQQDDDYFSQELQLAYESDRLNVIGGLYYFDRNFQQNAQTYASLPFFLLNGCTSSNAPRPEVAPLCPTLNSVASVFIPLLTGRARERVVSGKRVSVSLDLCVCRLIKN